MVKSVQELRVFRAGPEQVGLYSKDKPTKMGIKIFVLADALTDYV